MAVSFWDPDYVSKIAGEEKQREQLHLMRAFVLVAGSLFVLGMLSHEAGLRRTIHTEAG